MIIPSLINHKYKYIVILVPKNGTRSLRDYFLFTTGEQYKCLNRQYELIKKKYKNQYYTFAFTRNPYSRVVSFYLNKMIRPPEKIINKQLTPFELKPDISFEEFIDWLCNNPHGADNVDPHWSSQASQIPKSINFIGKLEHFDQDLLFAVTRIGIEDPKDIRHLNFTTKEGSNYTEDFKYIEKPKDQGSVDYMSYYNDATLKMVQERYAEDFKRFEYRI